MFLKRLAAMVYDSILIAALLIISTVLFLIFTLGEHISPNNFYFKLYLSTIWIGFFVWFWVRGGQTIGLAAWKLRLVTEQNQPLSIDQALLRFIIAMPLIAMGGVGLIWAIFDKQGQTLYDKLARTKLISMPKNP
jgi:uncharacterized RDD family membrane protein YckC